MKLAGDCIFDRMDTYRNIQGVKELIDEHDEKARELIEAFCANMPAAWHEVAAFPISINLHDEFDCIEIYATLAGYNMVL